VAGSLNAVAVKAGGGGSRNKKTPKGPRSNRQNKKDTSSDFLVGLQQPGKYYFIILLLLHFFLKNILLIDFVEFGTSSAGFIELTRQSAEVPISTAKGSRIANNRTQESLSAATGVSSTSSTNTIGTGTIIQCINSIFIVN
jgi:hypothetical protein